MNYLISIFGTLLGVIVGAITAYFFNSRLWVRQARLNLDIGVVDRVESIVQQLVSVQAKGRGVAGSGESAIEAANQIGGIWNPAETAFQAAAGLIRERFDTCDVRKRLAKFEEALEKTKNISSTTPSSDDFMEAASGLLSELQVEVFRRIR